MEMTLMSVNTALIIYNNCDMLSFFLDKTNLLNKVHKSSEKLTVIN